MAARLVAGLACVVLLGEIGGGPSRALASCGDYLIVGNGHSPLEMANQHALPGGVWFPAVSLRGPQDNPHDNSPAPHRAPCHGPNCSSRSELPATANVVVRMAHDPTWACLESREALSPLPPCRARGAEPTWTPQEVASRLLRPPR